jgi:anti-sigma regulatory factor (Ser/Thr protein kinase)
VNSQSTDDDLALELPVAPESAGRARHALAGLVPLALESDVALAVSEAVSNSVLHAYIGRPPGTITVRARQEPERLVVTVTDDGAGMKPNLNSKGLGVGVGLIREVTSEMRIESSAAGTTVWMAFAVPP